MVDTHDDVDISPHIPVLFKEVLSALNLSVGSRIIDGTIGAAGHAAGILATTGPNGLLLGLDRDPTALNLAQERLLEFSSRVILKQDSYANMAEHMQAVGWDAANGVLLDLGLSSMQLEDAERGFSFRFEGPLDMRYDPAQPLTAAELINHLDEKDLADTFRMYGEEPKAGRIARAIVEARPIQSTRDLADLVLRTLGERKRRIHPATRVFQALRIAVNDELDNLREGLTQASSVLVEGGRLAVISFHSLEDRIVKQFLRQKASACTCPPEQLVCTCGQDPELQMITRKPIRPSEEEIVRNPRARSARLRVAEKRLLA
jgi:16S rRNA (cytosine1402-N4)-methyltransferase